MITIALLVIGFLVTGGAFGAQVIGAFSIAQYWLWFIAGLATLIALIVIIGLTFLGGAKAQDEKFSKLGTALTAGVGGIVGSFIAILMVASSYVQLWLSYYIIDNVPADATSWSELPANITYAIIGFFILVVLSFTRSNKSSK